MIVFLTLTVLIFAWWQGYVIKEWKRLYEDCKGMLNMERQRTARLMIELSALEADVINGRLQNQPSVAELIKRSRDLMSKEALLSADIGVTSTSSNTTPG